MNLFPTIRLHETDLHTPMHPRRTKLTLGATLAAGPESMETHFGLVSIPITLPRQGVSLVKLTW